MTHGGGAYWAGNCGGADGVVATGSVDKMVRKLAQRRPRLTLRQSGN